MIALYWDIDGTLLTTDRAGVHALEAALADVFGVDRDLMSERLPTGLTEHQIAGAVFALAGVQADAQQTEAFVRSYEGHLPAALPRRQGRVLPGVREILSDLVPETNVRSFLLTGNTEAGARAKLEHYGLTEFFDDGAFCIGPGARSDIARAALLLAPDADVRYVIGDTPHDIEAGKAIDARTIAVATGSHTAKALADDEPWAVLERLPAPAEFRALIELH
ncbi:MAG TPA: HAD hydrolase-like protein [Gaiellaceae bacterium]|nr:HAD hydrolase-like protein [Gaiellaceae bacterium]